MAMLLLKRDQSRCAHSSYSRYIVNGPYFHAEQQVEGLRRIKADAYITKPFDFRILRHTIEQSAGERKSTEGTFHGGYSGWVKKVTMSRKSDLRFVSEFTSIVESNIGNEEFSIENIYKQMNISKVQLYRKVKALIGTNINEYILNTRLQKARYFLQHEDISVAEVAYRTGFSSPAYFFNSVQI